MREYELTLIVRPEVEEEGMTALIERLSQQIASNGGQVIKVEPWGRRKLAYPVRKVREGQYVLLRTQLQQQAIGELERNLKLNENVIRHLLVRVGE